MSAQGYVVAHLSEIPENEPGERPWLPVRYHVGARAFGVNVWIGREPGTRVLDEHTEENGDEELYFVVSGRATFTIAGEEVDATAGTFVFVPAGASTSSPSTVNVARPARTQ